MFEKNRASNTTAAAIPVPARLTLMSGEIMNGQVMSHGTGRLQEVLSVGTGFVEFHSHTGEIRNFNKAAILSLDPVSIPAADQLNKRNLSSPVFDPYQILGVNTQTDLPTIRNAYYALARRYHPDNYQTMDLPNEVKDYLGAMAKRINVAWETISQNQPATEEPADQA